MRKFLQKVMRAALVFFVLVLYTNIQAATFTIADGDVTALKAAINTSSVNNESDIINLAPFGTYTLTTSADYFEGDIGLPIVGSDGTSTLTINGNGATLIRNSTEKFRLLYCIGNTTINNLHFTNGDLGSDGNKGGALAVNSGTYFLTGCTFYSNKTDIAGGALYVSTDSYCTVSNCTFTDNSAATGSAIYNFVAKGVYIYNSTLAGNTATSATGETVTNADVTKFTYVRSSIITNNTLGTNGAEVGDGTVLQGGSLIGSAKPSTLITTGSPNSSGDYVTTSSAPIDAKLNALGDNGGFTKTMSLQATSPAINKGSIVYIVDTDQRGFARVGVLDAGAFEYNAPVAAPVIATSGLDITMGPVGTVLTISGANMSGVTEVKFQGAAGVTNFSTNTTKKVIITVPTGATSGQITVTTAAGTSALSTQSFTVGTPVPVISATGLSITSGPVGTSLTISGTNLSDITQIKFQGATVITTGFTSNTATSVTVPVPSGATSGKITVTTAGGTSALSMQTFTVTTVTAIKSIAEEHIVIYPNPFEQTITLDFSEAAVDTDVKVVSMTGDIVKAFSLTELSTTIDMSTLTSGVYLVYLTNNDSEVSIYRIIKK